MIKYRLLPQERIFNLEDFLIFHEMHMSCKELPAEDVEECIRYIKVNAPMLAPQTRLIGKSSLTKYPNFSLIQGGNISRR
jgi:hypothetical protein